MSPGLAPRSGRSPRCSRRTTAGARAARIVGAALLDAPPRSRSRAGSCCCSSVWYGVLIPAWRAPGNPLARRLDLREISFTDLLPVLLIAALGASVVVPVLGQLERTGVASSWLFFVAVGLMLCALILRLGGFARTRLRALVTVALALALTRLAMEGGLILGHDWLTDTAPVISSELLLGVAAWTLAFACLVEVAMTITVTGDADVNAAGWRAWVAAKLEAPLLRRSITDAMSAFGLIAAVLAAFALVGAVIAATSAGRARSSSTS